MRKKAFFRNLPTIAGLGILGTYIAFAVITFTLHGFSKVLRITLAVSLPVCCHHYRRLQHPDLLQSAHSC